MHSHSFFTQNLEPKVTRVLMIADVPNGTFERHARALHALLSDEFDFTLAFQGKNFNEADFDLIYPLEFNLLDVAKIHNPAKYITGIRSHLSWQSLDFLAFAQSLTRNFRAVHVVSKRLQNLFQPFVPQIQLISHGVDTRFFIPNSRSDQSSRGLRLGWVGNRQSASGKGFEEIIKPLGKVPGVELVICGDGDRTLSFDQMKDFYDSLDAYVCASDFEGNNNSLMEAASMQRAIITTGAGTVPEYLKNDESALIVERELPNFIQAVMRLRDDPSLRVRLGSAAGQAVKAKYEWSQVAEGYRGFFRTALKSGSASQAFGTRPEALPVSTPSSPRIKFPESKLAHQFLDGLQGLEIGGSAHNPFGLKTRNVDYCADLTTVFKLEEVRMCGEALKVDVVARGDLLPLPDESEDFVISSHVIEHFFDPIKAIKEWLRVVRAGGYVFIIAPHKERTFDKARARTPLQELVDRHSGKTPPPDVDTHEHYSVWITEDLLKLCQHLAWNVVAFQDVDDKVGNGFTLVIKKAQKNMPNPLELNLTARGLSEDPKLSERVGETP